MPVLALSGDVDMLPGVDTSFFAKVAKAIADMVQQGTFNSSAAKTTMWTQRSLLLCWVNFTGTNVGKDAKSLRGPLSPRDF